MADNGRRVLRSTPGVRRRDRIEAALLVDRVMVASRGTSLRCGPPLSALPFGAHDAEPREKARQASSEEGSEAERHVSSRPGQPVGGGLLSKLVQSLLSQSIHSLRILHHGVISPVQSVHPVRGGVFRSQRQERANARSFANDTCMLTTFILRVVSAAAPERISSCSRILGYTD